MQVLGGRGVELAQHRRQARLLQPDPLELALEQLAPGLFVARAVELVEPAAHLLPRARAGKEAVRLDQPVAARLSGLRGQDLHAVAALQAVVKRHDAAIDLGPAAAVPRSEEHTSELQSRENLVCRLLLEKKKTQKT